jgi:hypothetical protein
VGQTCFHRGTWLPSPARAHQSASHASTPPPPVAANPRGHGLIPTSMPKGRARLPFRFPLTLAFTPALLYSRTRATMLLAIDSHYLAAYVPSVRAIRSASTPCTFYTEFLPGAPATKVGRQSSPCHRLPPRELTIECCAPSFSSHALTSRRSPASSQPTSATPSLSMTYCPSRHRLSPHRCEPRHQPPPLVSASPSNPSDPVHHRMGLPLTTTFPANSLSAGRNRPAEPRRWMGGSLPCFSSQAESAKWVGPLPSQVGRIPLGAAQSKCRV